MLPEKFAESLEIGNIKDPLGLNAKREPSERQSVKFSLTKYRKKGTLKSFSIFVCVAVALSSIAFTVAESVSNASTLAQSVFDNMLRSNFPAPTWHDIPTVLIPDETESTRAPETTATPETTVSPETTAPPPETSAPPETTAPPEVAAPDIYDFDYSLVPSGSMPIIPVDLSARELGEFYISNETPYNPDVEALTNKQSTVAAWSDLSANPKAPVVLIIHTHGTEAYSEDGAVSYDENTIAPRSENVAENVVAVGSVMASVFRNNGVPTLHCTILHDQESYKDSYNRAAATIKEYLKKYPSIKYVFDVHRDSLIRENGEKLRPVAKIDGEEVAQVMSVVGTDYKGAAHSEWETNLSLAAKLQSALGNGYEGLARPIYLRGASFNQQYTNGSLLLEIGSCGNTLEEAKRAGEIVAEVLSQIIKGN